MKKKLIQLAGALYVCFALLAAYTAVAPFEASVADSRNQSPTVATPSRPLLDRERLDYSDTTTAKSAKGQYEIRVWSSSWCGACKTWKAKELPALLKAGYKVKVLDYQTDDPPPEVKLLPTIQLVFKGKVLKTEVNWKAKDIDRYVEGLLKLKK